MREHPMQETSFAPAGRKSAHDVARDVTTVAANPVVNALLETCGGLVAVLNAERQVVAVNDALLQSLDVHDPGEALGLRPGEALHCIHARDHEAGCGCSEFCRTCGAAIAIVACLDRQEPREEDCLLTVEREGEPVDLYFTVKATPINVEGQSFVLIFLQDVTVQRRQAELARVFFHDVNNLVQALHGTCSLLPDSTPQEAEELSARAGRLSMRLGKEVAIQRALLDSRGQAIPLSESTLDVDEVLQEIRSLFADHPLGLSKRLTVRPSGSECRVRSDLALALRVIGNMVANALEATDDGGEVSLWCERHGDTVRFCVHNDHVITGDVAKRVFQRHFSTKGGSGRGLGTYAMKLLGERHLGGRVEFTSDAADGTVFRFSLPVVS